MSIVTAEPAQVVSVDYAHEAHEEEEEEEEGSMVTMMQDASVQTSETGQDYQEMDEEPRSDVVTVQRNRTRPEEEEEEEEEEMGVAGVGGSDESDGTNEEISRCTQMVGHPKRDQSQVTRTVTAQSQTYPNSSDTASEIGGLLDSDKMHPEGDDYKIVFISSDSSKSGDDSLEGSFDNDPLLLLGMDHHHHHHHHHHQMMHSHSRQTCRSSSVHDSESAAGFIDESDWDFFAARGQQQPPVVVTMPIQQQQQQQQFQLLPEPVKPAPQPPQPSTVTVGGQTAHSSCGSGVVRLRGLTTADDSSQRSSFGIESPRTFMMDDFNYGWTSVDETPSVSHRGSTIDDCLPGWSSMVTYASRQVQTDFDASSVSVDFEAETFHSEYETMSHFIRDGPPPPPPPPPPPAHRVTEHFVPIWQVPASSRSSTHSLHSLLSETTATNQSAAGPGKLRSSYFSRSDSKRSSGERSVEELSYHDHILSLEPTSNSFISSLYSPEGMALPGFQEYRDRIFTEIQAYTAKGDWNLTNAVTSPIASSPELRHPTRSRPGSSNSSWLAGPLLGKINNTYRIRPTGSRVAVAPAAKRWRGNGCGDVSPPAVETTTTTTAAAATNEVSASAPQIESVHLSQQCSHALPDQQQQLVQLLQHTREEEKQHFHLNGQIGNHANSRPSSSTNICLPSHSSSQRVESRASATTTSSSAVPSQSIPSSASSPVDNQSTTVVTVNRLPLDKSEPVALPVHRSSYTSDHSLLCCVADAGLQPSSLQRNLSSQRAQVAESSPPWKSGPPHHSQTPPPTLPPAAAAAAPPLITAVGDHSSSLSSSSPPAIDGSVATVAKTSSPNAISTGGPPCPPFPSSVASSTAAAAIQEPMEIHDNDDDDDVISHCCASPLLSAASCQHQQHHHHQPHMNSPRAPLPPALADSAGLDSPPPTPPTLLLSPPLSPGPVGVAFTETSERDDDDDDEIAKVQTTVDCSPFTYVMPHSYSVNGQQSEKDDEKKEKEKEEKEIMIRSAVLHPNDTTLIAPGSPFGYSAPATPMQDENVTAQDQGEGQQQQQQQQQQQHAGHEGKTVETNAMSSPSSSSSSSSSTQLASSIASSSRFEVLAAELPPPTPAGLTHTEGRSRPLRLLSSDSDVTDNDDSCSNGAGGGFDTDTQQETVVQGLNNAAYNDLRQFAIKQSSSQKDVASSASSAVASSPVQLLDPQSDTDSSSSISSQQPPAKRSSNGGSVTASPVLSDGRSTPRRQYTSYVLIKGGNSGGKASTGGSSGSSDHVISDDESGVTVTLPREPATAATAAASIVQVPDSVSPTGATAEWMAGEEEGGGSDSETNEESGSCVTISGNGVLTDHDLATSDDEEMNSERNGVSSKLAKYFTFELESAAGYTADHSARKQPVVHRNQVEMRSSPDPYNDHHGGEEVEQEEEEEEVSLTSIEDHDQSNSLEQETLHYESDPSDSRLDSIGDDGESLYSESGASSGDEVYMDQEEELRGYNQRAIDFTLHTILEESCEESDGGERKSRAGGDKRMSNKEPSELEKYFTQGLGSSSNASGAHDRNDDGTGAKQRRTSFANEESEYSDTFSETSSSIYSEGRSGGEEEDETDPVELASSRLEKYFRTNFLGLEGAGGHGNRAEMLGKAKGNNTSSDGSESVGSDSEGHPSPEQQRRKKVMKTRGLRGQQMQASGGGAAAADWSRSSLVGSDLDDGAQSDSLSTDPDSLPLDSLHHSVSSSSPSGDDDDEEEEEEEEEIVMEKTDGQFDTIKRRKKKRSAGDSNQQAVEKQLAIIEDQAAAAMQQQTNFTTDDTDKTLEALNAQMKTTPQVPPPPLPAVLVDVESQAAAVAVAVAAVPASASGLDPNCPRKYQSRDSGFVGSCDDLLNDSQKGIRQRLSSESGGSSDGVTDEKTKKTAASALTPSGDDDFNGSNATLVNKPDESDSKSGKSVGSSGSSGDHGGSLTSTSQSSKSGKLSRKDSFNNWSSDEETNLMMNKMRAFFRNLVSGGGGNNDGGSEKTKPPQLVVFETELTRLMKSVPGINDQQVKEIVEYLSSEDTWSDSYDSSDYTSSDLEAAGAVLDQSTLLPELLGDRSDLQQQISASCQEIIEKFDLDRSPDGSHLQIDAVGSNAPWLHVGSVDDASNSLNKETAFVYQRLVNSLMRLNNGPKLPATNATAQSTAPVAAGPSSEDPSTSQQQPHQNSPPMIAKVLHHIGNRLVALMHEVSASSPDTTSHSGSLDEDAQSASRLKELRLAAHFEPVTSSPRLPKVGRLYVSNKDHHSCSDDKRSLSTSIDSEDTPTDTEQSPDSSDDSRNRKKNGDTSNSNIKFGFESLHTYEKRMSSSLPPQLVGVEQQQQQQQQQQPRSSSSLRGDGFASLPEENSRSSGNFIGGSRSVKARLAERARTLEAERRRMAEEQQQQQQQQLQEMSVSAAAAAVASASVVEEDPADEDRFYKKARKLPRFSLFARTSRDSANRDALQSSSSGVSDIAEEKEDEFSGWRSSFESAIAADSRTKLSLEAKRRSAGSASSSELFASTGELLDRDSSRGLRVRGASAGHSSKFSLPNLLERDAVRMARERDRERSASSDVLLSTSPVASSAMLSSVADHQQSGDAEDEDGAWDRLVITRLSSKRRSSVPDTREERGSAEASEPRSTTLPRSATALSAVENELDLGSSSSPSISVSTAGVKKSLSLLLSHTTTNSASETSLNTSNDATPVRSARYRPPGFRGHTGSASSGHHVETTPKTPQRSNTPQRAPSAPWLGAESVTPRSTGSAASLSSRRNVRSMLADERREPYSSSPSFVREGLRTSVASSAASGESFSSVSASDTLDDSELSATTVNNKSRSASLSALGTRSDSMASVYSAAGEARYGTVAVRGEIQFGLHYNYRQTALEVFVKQCKDLAPVDTKRNRSDPYAKVYLLPDRSKSGKRKTKVKKHTLSPLFEENLKFTTSLSDLENRTLWLTVWHSDMFGRNDFLGEITLPLAGRIFDDPTPHWYQLQERSEMVEDPGVMPFYRGDMIVALKYIPGESSPTKRTKKSKGALHVIVKEAKGLIPARPNGNIDALCKGTLMPEKGKTTKHKTSICRRTSNPVWNCTFIFDDVAHQELKERALELDIWNHDRLATKEFLGGLRLNLGTGLFQGKPVEWMDASGKEVTLWQSVVERAGLWVEGSVPLRTAMERPSGE
ncbi:CG33555-PC-like protein [Daphnia pulex]|uniref:CG33555-PC-like protein n=1 Tax=Daphnia pulex TaxID=6669 RepID=E9FSI9_DAPPU|nr:CG33555-PC-like protein [Daphnia pulex]|eukprot:EFX89823.1 CG33555-PC-like protein [Daphnia pulex]